MNDWTRHDPLITWRPTHVSSVFLQARCHHHGVPSDPITSSPHSRREKNFLYGGVPEDWKKDSNLTFHYLFLYFVAAVAQCAFPVPDLACSISVQRSLAGSSASWSLLQVALPPHTAASAVVFCCSLLVRAEGRGQEQTTLNHDFY